MKTIRLVLAFFRVPISEACLSAERLLDARGIRARWRIVERVNNLDSLRDQLPPEGAPPNGAFFVSPQCNSWTGFFSRQTDGWYTLVNALCASAPDTEAIYITGDLMPTQYPSTSFEVFRGGRSVRSIRASKEDDGWHFINRGEPLEFEDTSHYARRLISDRMNIVIVDGILSRMNINLAAVLNGEIVDVKVLET